MQTSVEFTIEYPPTQGRPFHEVWFDRRTGIDFRIVGSVCDRESIVRTKWTIWSSISRSYYGHQWNILCKQNTWQHCGSNSTVESVWCKWILVIQEKDWSSHSSVHSNQRKWMDWISLWTHLCRTIVSFMKVTFYSDLGSIHHSPFQIGRQS